MITQPSADVNPYAASTTNDIGAMRSKRAGRIGLVLSIVGLAGLFSASAIGATEGLIATYFISACVTCLAIPGTILSLIALLQSPRRLAVYGTIIGIGTTANVTTVFMPIIRGMRQD